MFRTVIKGKKKLVLLGAILVLLLAVACSSDDNGETPGNIADLLSDRKSTRLNSSHKPISYAVFCLQKKTPPTPPPSPPSPPLTLLNTTHLTVLAH